MAERVLSDEEVFTIICGTTRTNWDTRTIARAVEAAVVAKMEKRLVCDWGKPCINIERAEHEARKRERAAYERGWKDCPPHVYHSLENKLGVALMDSRDKKYPLPTKRVPRTVTLSDGLMVSATGVSIGPSFYFTRREFGAGGCAGSTMNPLSFAKTPDDARALADLVERPFDEVPDDGPQVVGTL